MSKEKLPIAIAAANIPPRKNKSVYPEPFASRMAGREKRQLGDYFELTNFGVNLTRLIPGAMSALRHSHTKQDEFIYVIQGKPTLYTNEGATVLSPGMCSGSKAGSGNACNLVNETPEDVIYLEIGDRLPGDNAHYPDDDLKATSLGNQWKFTHKDDTPY